MASCRPASVCKYVTWSCKFSMTSSNWANSISFCAIKFRWLIYDRTGNTDIATTSARMTAMARGVLAKRSLRLRTSRISVVAIPLFWPSVMTQVRHLRCGARYLRGASAALPMNWALGPSSCSMRSSWLYLATRSLRAGAPVLI